MGLSRGGRAARRLGSHLGVRPSGAKPGGIPVGHPVTLWLFGHSGRVDPVRTRFREAVQGRRLRVR
eukprot:15444171-Alexandrium_andersonii.AAC.1